MRTLLLYWLLLSPSFASEALKSWADPLDVLPKLTASAAGADAPFRPYEYHEGEATIRYYLSQVYYVGSSATSFGRVHVACFHFTRLYVDSKPATQFGTSTTILGFFDESFHLRDYWDVSLITNQYSFQLEGTKLCCAKSLVFDFADAPRDRQIVFEKKPYRIPIWK